jgi:nitrite reductase/ring-hydroxylating ferredoxin subunit
MGPLESAIPRRPASWYLFDHVRSLRRGPQSRELLGRRLVAFRTESGRFAVLDAACAHMGADLGRGHVVGERILCPYHHWEYGPDGRAARIPTQRSVPPSACVAGYPCVERHGYLFFFNGPEPLFPLPFFFDCDPAEFAASRVRRFTLEGPWYFLPGNAFDGQHFESVHDRRLLAPPAIDEPAPFARRVQFHAEVTGDSVYDRLLRRFVGREVRVSITSFGGPYVLVTGEFRRAKSYILVANRPLDERTAASDVVVYAPRRGPRVLQPLWLPLMLAVRSWFTRGFMNDDFDRLRGMRYEPERLVAADRDFARFLAWLCELPQTSVAAGPITSASRLATEELVK